MNKLTKRTLILLCSFFGLIAVYTYLYHWLYENYEGISITYTDALQTVVEAVTTAGFGGHAPWSSDVLNLFVVVMNLTGVTIFFFTIPLIITPYLRKTLSEPPTSTSKENHIIVVSDEYSSDKSLIKELSKINRSYVFLEADKERASDLYRQDVPVVHADAKTEEGLNSANLDEAESIITDVSDRDNLTILYMARQINDEVKRFAIVSDSRSESLCYSAGADEVLNIANEVGMVLSNHIYGTFSERFGNIMEENYNFDISKLVVLQGSPVAGVSLNSFSRKYLDGQAVIAGHFGNDFIVSPTPEDVIEPNSVLYIIGSLEQDIEKAEVKKFRNSVGDKILVLGNGRIGSEVSRFAESSGYNCVTVDSDSNTNPDIVGDITNPTTFEDIDFEEYMTVVVSVDDDVAATYACTIISNMTDNVKIVSRANNTSSVQNMYLADADQVILIPKIMDSYWSSALGEGENTYSIHNQIDMDIVQNRRYDGVAISETDIGQEIGSRVVSVKSDEEWFTNNLDDVEIQDGDYLLVVGTEYEVEATREFFQSTDDS